MAFLFQLLSSCIPHWNFVKWNFLHLIIYSQKNIYNPFSIFTSRGGQEDNHNICLWHCIPLSCVMSHSLLFLMVEKELFSRHI
jgi:hypothetical protein